jgi:hypothetical protein
MMKAHSITRDEDSQHAYDATWAFQGGFNNHSRIARLKLRQYRIAMYLPIE